MKDNNVILIPCSCGCSYLKIEKWTHDEDHELYSYDIAFYKNNFYGDQHYIFATLYERWKRAFLTLIGRDYRLFDISVPDQHFEEIVDELFDLIKK